MITVRALRDKQRVQVYELLDRVARDAPLPWMLIASQLKLSATTIYSISRRAIVWNAIADSQLQDSVAASLSAVCLVKTSSPKQSADAGWVLESTDVGQSGSTAAARRQQRAVSASFVSQHATGVVAPGITGLDLLLRAEAKASDRVLSAFQRAGVFSEMDTKERMRRIMAQRVRNGDKDSVGVNEAVGKGAKKEVSGDDGIL
ncbi:hypothetical protein BC830DRAFT_833923 [Chytriomyces sp. MP71]|nr:hypothetical protein BC830DRAFT_833923 [Chytriomyces sp. MP71]